MGVLTGWKYRKKVTIQGSTGAGTNYPVILKIGESFSTWQANTSYSLGKLVKPTAGSNRFFYECTTAGTSGATEPTWPTTDGATVTDGTVVWTARKGITIDGLSDNFPSGKNQSGDLRFTSSDGSTLLSFWVENVTGVSPNRVAYVWVKVLEDLGTNRDIYCYFGGGASASNVSSIINTFIDGDDFISNTTTNYTVVGGSISYDATNKRLNITGTSGNTVVAKTNAQSLAFPYVIEAKMSVVKRGTGDSLGNYTSAVLGFKTTLTGNDGYAFDFGRLTTTLTSHISVEKYTVAHLVSASITYSDGVLYLIKGLCQAGNLQTTFERTTSTPVSTDTSYISGYYGLRTWYADSVVDWWFVRKYVSPEPTFLSAGTLEFLGSRRRLLISTY